MRWVVLSFNEGEIRVRAIVNTAFDALELVDKLRKTEKNMEHDCQFVEENYE
jgi:hypothetical protein